MEAAGGDVMGTGAAFGYLAGILLIAAVLMTSIRALRVFALAAGLAAVAYFAYHPSQTIGMVLAALFVLVNGIQLLVVIRRARSGSTLADERKLFTEVLAIDNPAQQRRLRDLIEWRDARFDEVLMEEGQHDPPLIYVASGAASIEHDGQIVGVCGAGDFAGEMSLVSGEAASATVRVTNKMRIAEFDRDALGHFSREVPEVGNAISSALNRGLAAKVARMNEAAMAKGGGSGEGA